MIIQDFEIKCEADCANRHRCVCSRYQVVAPSNFFYPHFSIRNKNNYYKSGKWSQDEYELNCRDYEEIKK